MRPVIGITTYVEPASWVAWRDVPAALVPQAYVDQVAAAGGLPVLVPPLPADATEQDVRSVLSRLDGLVLAGGADVEPAAYGEQPHPSVQEPRRDRDASELRLARATSGGPLPVLGICRGMQVMAVAAGGRLTQHVPDVVGHDDHAPAPATYGTHAVRVEAGTRLRDILGDVVEVPSYHHQSVAAHPGYEPTAWAPDGLLEAFETAGTTAGQEFRLAVQWHPEVGTDPRLFEALVAAARPARSLSLP